MRIQRFFYNARQRKFSNESQKVCEHSHTLGMCTFLAFRHLINFKLYFICTYMFPNINKIYLLFFFIINNLGSTPTAVKVISGNFIRARNWNFVH